MSIAHKWLEQEPWPTKAMPKDMLENRIERALTLTNLGCLGTARKDGYAPRQIWEREADSTRVVPGKNSPI